MSTPKKANNHCQKILCKKFLTFYQEITFLLMQGTGCKKFIQTLIETLDNLK